jgi:hypothetical protein
MLLGVCGWLEKDGRDESGRGKEGTSVKKDEKGCIDTKRNWTRVRGMLSSFFLVAFCFCFVAFGQFVVLFSCCLFLARARVCWLLCVVSKRHVKDGCQRRRTQRWFKKYVLSLSHIQKHSR